MVLGADRYEQERPDRGSWSGACPSDLAASSGSFCRRAPTEDFVGARQRCASSHLSLSQGRRGHLAIEGVHRMRELHTSWEAGRGPQGSELSPALEKVEW